MQKSKRILFSRLSYILKYISLNICKDNKIKILILMRIKIGKIPFLMRIQREKIPLLMRVKKETIPFQMEIKIGKIPFLMRVIKGKIYCHSDFWTTFNREWTGGNTRAARVCRELKMWRVNLRVGTAQARENLIRDEILKWDMQMVLWARWQELQKLKTRNGPSSRKIRDRCRVRDKTLGEWPEPRV